MRPLVSEKTTAVTLVVLKMKEIAHSVSHGFQDEKSLKTNAPTKF